MLKIAFVGRAMVGKTFCAEYLRDRYRFNRKSMADPIKKFIKAMYYFDKRKQVSWETRRAMYDALYKLDNNIWITSMKGRMERAIKDTVIDDVRYMNEAKALIEMGFIIIRVTKPRTKVGNFTKTLGKEAAPGLLVLHELYNRDFTKELQVSYTINNESNDSMRKSLDLIMAELGKVDKYHSDLL